jgi:hypothetical protein
MNNIEKNMIRGLFMRKLKDFAEDNKKQKATLFERLKNPVVGPD